MHTGFRMFVLATAAVTGASAQTVDVQTEALIDSVESGEAAWGTSTQERLVRMASAASPRVGRRAWNTVLARSADTPRGAASLEDALSVGDPGLRAAEAALRTVLTSEHWDDSKERLVAQVELLTPDGGPNRSQEARVEDMTRMVVESDPVPASTANERLLVHIARLGVALRRYADESSATGLDARGETWVRYGEPDRSRAVSFDDGEILGVARNRGIHVSRSDFPDNEVWVYDRLSDQGIYIFVRGRDGRYVLGDVNSLIPRGLRSRGGNRGPRAAGYTEVGFLTLRHVLGQLALFHPSYSSRYAEVQNYVSYVQENERSSRLNARGQSQVPSIVTFNRSPSQGFTEVIARNEVGDAGIEAARAETMPVESSAAVLDAADVQLVRFLEEGRTVREVMWGAPPGRRSRAWRVGAGREQLVDTLGTEFVRFEAEVPHGASVAVQVDRPVGNDGALWRAEASGYASAKPDLRADAALELSDPLPFESQDVMDDGASLREAIARGEIRALTRSDLSGLEGVGVYLEAYLADPRSPLEVRYRIVTRRDGRLFRPRSSETEEFSFIRPVNQEVVPIAFLVDRANWEGADEVDFEIEVEHLRSGAVSRRSVTFRAD